MPRDELPQETEDALVNLVMTKLLEKGLYSDAMASLRKAGKDGLVEDSMDRHAARMRAQGERGW